VLGNDRSRLRKGVADPHPKRGGNEGHLTRVRWGGNQKEGGGVTTYDDKEKKETKKVPPGLQGRNSEGLSRREKKYRGWD